MKLGQVGDTGNFLLSLAKGNIDRHSAITKFGENPDIDIADGFSDVWAGKSVAGGTQKYVAPTTARTHDVVSTDVADDGTVLSSGTMTGGNGGAGGTIEDTAATFVTDTVAIGDLVLNDAQAVLGSVVFVNSETVLTLNAWFNPNNGLRESTPVAGDAYRVVTPAAGASVLHINGLDATFVIQEEFVVLDGLVVVPTAGDYTRINRMRAFGAGAQKKLVGNAIVTAQTDSTVTAAIIDGDNQTMQALYTVPSDKDAYLVSWSASVSKKQTGVINARLRLGQFNEIMFVTDSVALHSQGSGAASAQMGYQRIPGGTDILVEGDADTNNMGASAGFQLVLVDV